MAIFIYSSDLATLNNLNEGKVLAWRNCALWNAWFSSLLLKANSKWRAFLSRIIAQLVIKETNVLFSLA